MSLSVCCRAGVTTKADASLNQLGMSRAGKQKQATAVGPVGYNKEATRVGSVLAEATLRGMCPPIPPIT